MDEQEQAGLGDRRAAARRMTGTAWAVAAGALAVGLVVGTGLGGAGGLAVGSVLAARAVDAGTAAGVAASPERTVEEALAQELPELRSFVARERGLAWQEDVPVRALDDEAFDAALAAPEEEPWPAGPDDPGQGRSETYAALGLTPSAEDYRAAWEDGGSSVLGFYDDVDEEIVLRGVSWTPVVAETLVHELVHALDDQHVGLSSRGEDMTGTESVAAWTAVVEGDAERVAWAWFDTLDDEEVDAYDAAWEDDPSGFEDADYDPLLDTLSYFPYESGFEAVEEAHSRGGAAAVDALLADPPTTTEQVLQAREWLEQDPSAAPAVEVLAPTAPDGSRVLGSGTLGAAVLSLLPQVEQAQDEGLWLEDVVEGWAGDAWTTWVDPQDPGRACTLVVVRLEDARAREDVADELSGWLEEQEATAVPSGDSDLQLSSCGDL